AGRRAQLLQQLCGVEARDGCGGVGCGCVGCGGVGGGGVGGVGHNRPPYAPERPRGVVFAQFSRPSERRQNSVPWRGVRSARNAVSTRGTAAGSSLPSSPALARDPACAPPNSSEPSAATSIPTTGAP